MERNGRFDAFHDKLVECPLHFFDALFAGTRPADEFGNHGIVVGRNGIAGVYVRIHANAVPFRTVERNDFPGAWPEIIERIFRVDAAFHGVGVGKIIFAYNGFAGGNFDLFFDQIVVNDLLRHRVFHLDAGIHFHEIEIAVFVHQKLDGAHAFIINALAGFYCSIAHFLPQFVGHERRRAFFYQFLVAALDGAVAFRQVNHFAVLVAHNLKFDVARFFDVFFDVDAVVAERRFGFLAGIVPVVLKILRFPDDAHPFPAAACRGFDDDGVADFFGHFHAVFNVFDQAIGTRHDRHSGFDHRFFGGDFIAHFPDLSRRRADKLDAVLGTDFRESGIFGQKTVPRVDGVGVGDFHGCHNLGNAQVRVGRSGRTDANGFVGKAHVQTFPVGGGINRNRFDAHFPAGANDAQGNLSAIGNEYFFKHILQDWSTPKRALSAFWQ